MNQDDFLAQLREYLYGLAKEEIHDIIQDYKEHFLIGLSKGKSEQEISRELGDPRTIAKGFINIGQRPVKKNNMVRNILIAILVVIILLFIIIPIVAFVLFSVSTDEYILQVESDTVLENHGIDISTSSGDVTFQTP